MNVGGTATQFNGPNSNLLSYWSRESVELHSPAHFILYLRLPRRAKGFLLSCLLGKQGPLELDPGSAPWSAVKALILPYQPLCCGSAGAPLLWASTPRLGPPRPRCLTTSCSNVCFLLLVPTEASWRREPPCTEHLCVWGGAADGAGQAGALVSWALPAALVGSGVRAGQELRCEGEGCVGRVPGVAGELSCPWVGR